MTGPSVGVDQKCVGCFGGLPQHHDQHPQNSAIYCLCMVEGASAVGCQWVGYFAGRSRRKSSGSFPRYFNRLSSNLAAKEAVSVDTTLPKW